NGIVAIVSLICPARAMRDVARETIGSGQFLEVFVDSSIQTCAARDVKGLYAKVNAGEIQDFTGKDSLFERPEQPDIHLRTDVESAEATLESLYQQVIGHITVA